MCSSDLFSQQKQGDWKYYGDYNVIERNYANTINTNLLGIGTDALTVTRTPQGTGSDVNLKTERRGFTFGGEKWISNNLQFETSFKTEEKTGARIFGRALTCNATAVGTANGYGCVAAGGTSPATAGAMLLLPEPINYKMNQFDAKFNWHTDKIGRAHV